MGPRSRSNPLHGLPAFSLVELVIVTAVVGIVAAIAVPRFTNASQRYRADAAAQRLMADVTLAQQEAINSSSSRTLTFDATNKKYTMTGTGAANAGGSTYTVELDDPPYHATFLSSAINGDSALPLKFDGYGKPNGPGTVVIKVGKDKRTITIEAETGRTQVN